MFLFQPIPSLPVIPAVPAPPPLSDALTAFVAHQWYAFAAIALMLLIQIGKRYELKLWTKTPVGVRFVWPIGLSMIAAFVHGYVTGESLHASLMDSLNSIWQIAFPAMGGAAALKESPLPWSGGAGGVPAADLEPPDGVTIPSPPPTSPADLRGLPSLNEDDRSTPVDPGPLPPAA